MKTTTLLRGIFLGLLGTAFLQCGGGGGGTSGAVSDNTTNITGTVFAPNGTDPIAGATVYIPGSSGNLATGTSLGKTVSSTCSGQTVTCNDPSVSALLSTCSCPDGSFSLDLSSLSATQRSALAEVKIEQGAMTKTVTLSCADTTCALAAGDTTMPASGTGALRMAVVTGNFDDIQDVLAKLGYGELDTDNRLRIGTEQFAIYRGGDSDLDSDLAAVSTTTYPEASTLFSSVTTMQNYDVIFINCGASESVSAGGSLNVKGLSHAEYHTAKAAVEKSIETTVVTNLQSYVNAGGTLYVTDLAYDFMEQAFPQVVDFQAGGDGDSATAETANAAELGNSGIVANATVNDTTLRTWLASRPSNTIDASTTPNNEACSTTTNGNTGSLQADNTIRIGDFLSSWAVMKAAYDSSTTVWIQSESGFLWNSTATDAVPLTVSRAIGSNGGKVIYSSYHTAHSCPTTGFWPQERVLQYLVLEASE